MHKKIKKEGDEDEDQFHQMMEEIEMLSDDEDDHYLFKKMKYLRRRFDDDDDESDKHVDQIVKIVANLNKAWAQGVSYIFVIFCRSIYRKFMLLFIGNSFSSAL